MAHDQPRGRDLMEADLHLRPEGSRGIHGAVEPLVELSLA